MVDKHAATEPPLSVDEPSDIAEYVSMVRDAIASGRTGAINLPTMGGTQND